MTGRKILVCSFGAPQFDRDSGSRRVMDLLELLVEQHWHVTFVSANGLRKPRYAEAMQRRGMTPDEIIDARAARFGVTREELERECVVILNEG